MITSPIRIAKKVLLGTMLGDSHIAQQNANTRKGRLILTHSARQFEYLLWKMQLLAPLVDDFYVGISIRPKRPSVLQAHTIRLHPLYHTHRDFYSFEDGTWKKKIRLNVLRRLSPLSLACWFQDDGHLNGYDNKKDGTIYGLSIATCNHSMEENRIIQGYFHEAWKINIAINCGRYPYVAMDTENAKKFIELIRPFIHPTMEYKINPLLHRAEHWVTNDDIVRTLQQCKDLVRNYQAQSKKALSVKWAEYVKGPKAKQAMQIRLS